MRQVFIGCISVYFSGLSVKYMTCTADWSLANNKKQDDSCLMTGLDARPSDALHTHICCLKGIIF